MFLLGYFLFEAKEAGNFMAGFVLVVLSVIIMTSGIAVKSGEFINGSTVSYLYRSAEDIVKVMISGVTLAGGLILFYSGLDNRKKRKEKMY